MTTIRRDLDRCTAMKKNGDPVAPCTSCDRFVNMYPYGHIRTPWTIPPAFWNGEEYVCEHHIELQPSSQTATN